MKVNIGPFINWWGPYQIVDAIFFWHEKYPEKQLENRWDYKLHYKISEFLGNSWVADTCQWVHNKRERRVKIHIDGYDVWNACDTMAMIILPMLKKLKENKHGSGWIEPEDAPKKFRPTAKQIEKAKAQGGWDDKNHLRYEWFLDEIIWTFEQLNDENSDEQFWIEHGEIDWNAGEADEKGCKPIVWKKKSKVDWKGLKAHNERIRNGLILFGKYFQTLWD